MRYGNQFIHSGGIATNICMSLCAVPVYTIIGQIKCGIIWTVNFSQTERRIGEYFLETEISGIISKSLFKLWAFQMLAIFLLFLYKYYFSILVLLRICSKFLKTRQDNVHFEFNIYSNLVFYLDICAIIWEIHPQFRK